ncbi:bcl2-associated agonist of cell death [Pelodytes ibericus]
MTDSSTGVVFSIDHFPSEQQDDIFTSTDPPSSEAMSAHRKNRSSPNLRKHKGKEARFRTESASESTENDSLGELHQFRSRSRSAPSSLLVAARYGRELRRMSDEFDQSFKGLPRPKSAGAAGQLTGNNSIKDMFMNFLRRRKSKEKNESTDDNL